MRPRSADDRSQHRLPVRQASRMLLALRYLRPMAMLGCLVSIGCAETTGSTTRPMTARERQDAAMRDPFGYGPNQDGSGSDIPSITGGGIGDFDRKAFERDLGKVLGP